MKYKIVSTAKFKKDLKLAKKQNKNIDKLGSIIALLQDGKPLPIKNRDHQLNGGKYDGCRECHIEPDWLLIYLVDKEIILLKLVRLGSHSSLFKK